VKVEAAITCEMLTTHPTSTQHYHPKAGSGMFLTALDESVQMLYKCYLLF